MMNNIMHASHCENTVVLEYCHCQLKVEIIRFKNLFHISIAFVFQKAST